MRSDFEKLPIIQEIMADEYDGLMFDERFSKYLCPSDGNEEYLNGAWMVWQQRQTEVDELQRRNQMLNDNIKEQGQKLVYQNEVIETQAEKLLGLRDEKAELQKRVDELQTAFKQLIEMENESISFEHDLFDKGWNQSARQTIENIYKLTGLGEQALKGGFDE